MEQYLNINVNNNITEQINSMSNTDNTPPSRDNNLIVNTNNNLEEINLENTTENIATIDIENDIENISPNIENVDEITEIEIAEDMPAPDVNKLNNLLQTYLALREEIKDKEANIKISRDKLKQISESMMTYYKVHNVKNIELGSKYKGYTVNTVYTKKQNAPAKIVVSEFYNYFVESQQVAEFDKIMKSIEDKTTIKETGKIEIAKSKSVKTGSTSTSIKKKMLQMEKLSNVGALLNNWEED